MPFSLTEGVGYSPCGEDFSSRLSQANSRRLKAQMRIRFCYTKFVLSWTPRQRTNMLSERRVFSPTWQRATARNGKKSPSVFSTQKRQITLAEPSRRARTVGVILMIQIISSAAKREQNSRKCSRIFFLPYPTRSPWTRSPSLQVTTEEQSFGMCRENTYTE